MNHFVKILHQWNGKMEKSVADAAVQKHAEK